MAKEYPELRLKLPTLSDLSELEISEVEWDVENLIPSESITVVQGKGGLGKTWLLLQIGSAIADGKSFCGLNTIQKNVIYIDYENPYLEIARRAKILGKSSMQYWNLINEPKPPRLDSEDWELFKIFSPSVLIFDSLRSSHYLDENSSQDMTFLMSRLKELRSLGNTIIGILHTVKSDPKIHRGSGAIIDQADHVLGLTRVKNSESDQSIDDDFDEDLPFRLGHVQKTRFIPFKIYLKFDPNCGFLPAPSPEEEVLKRIHEALIIYCKEHQEPSQKIFVDLIRSEAEVGKDRALSLIKKGDGIFWSSFLLKKANNQRVYYPITIGE